ncbi:hypothetical protein ARMSODRAFT_973377 [Armillaria solidipes]|uniref:Uncharacterized protein n=1 Tax=Armillaria solidipes TaxID=1076256 RepID=A0A2H3C0G3_9AGAR|nr:hypothetical protein ARMSODRAFT_973377 [Armillaria solidipes]
MFQSRATVNPQSRLKPGVPLTGNPAKSPEEMNMDKLCECQKGKEKERDRFKGGDPKDVSEDEKDEFNFILQMVEKAVEAMLLTSPASKPLAGSTLPTAATGMTTSTTSMDAILSNLFSDFNNDAISWVKITCMSADGSSKNFSVLDISKAPPESFGEWTLQGLNEHLYAMLSDPQFSRWFEAYKGFDKDYQAKLFKNPFIPDPSSKSWSDGIQRTKDNYLLMQQEA